MPLLSRRGWPGAGAVSALAALSCAFAGCSTAPEAPSVPQPPPGQALFVENCSNCHGERGEGVAGQGISLAGASRMDPAAIKQLLHTGRGRMPRVPLEEPELSQVVQYVQQLAVSVKKPAGS